MSAQTTNNGHGSPAGDGLVSSGSAAGLNDSVRPVSDGQSLPAAVEETERLAAGSIPARDRPMSAQTVDVLAIMRAASRHVPNEQYTDFDAAIDAVDALIAAARAAAESLRHRGAHWHADRLMKAINGATP